MGNTVTTEEKPEVIGKPRQLTSAVLKTEITLDIDVNHVISVAELAGQAIMDIYESEAESWDVNHKADDSPLTRADTEANRIICDALRTRTPHIPIISEENKLESYEKRQNYQYCWIVDPLDGTKEFIKRVPHFTVNIALVKGNTPVLGVVHTPAACTTHFAVEGQGSYVRSEGSDDKRIQCAEFTPQDEGLTLVGSASHMSAETQDFISLFKNCSLKQVGSSLKFLLVAEGLAHIYPRLAPTCEWDTAAAHIVVTEAGGEVVQAGLCDNKGKSMENWREVLAKEIPLVYNKPNALNPFFVVYGKRLTPAPEPAEQAQPEAAITAAAPVA